MFYGGLAEGSKASIMNASYTPLSKSQFRYNNDPEYRAQVDKQRALAEERRKQAIQKAQQPQQKERLFDFEPTPLWEAYKWTFKTMFKLAVWAVIIGVPTFWLKSVLPDRLFAFIGSFIVCLAALIVFLVLNNVSVNMFSIIRQVLTGKKK